MTVGYAICLTAAVGLLIAYLLMVKDKEFWLTMLYISIAVVQSRIPFDIPRKHRRLCVVRQ